jgi:PadR family transcriptional regulator PadR
MKEKPDVLQGTLVLLVLKTLDVLGSARRIEHIRGNLLSVNQGTLYPEGSIASEWGTSENNRRAHFYRLTRAAASNCMRKPGNPRPGANGCHHHATSM